MDSDNDARLVGIRGWLQLLAVCQGCGILKLLFGSIRGLEAYGPFLDIPGMRMVIAAQVVIDVSIIALALTTFGTLLDKKRSFLKWLFYQWIALPIILIFRHVVVWAALGVPLADMTDGADAKIAAAFLLNGLWVLYTRKSKRVANTMVN